MHRLIHLALALFFLAGISTTDADYHILLPQNASAIREKPVSFLFQFGHPFEHQLFDTSKPECLTTVLPDGKIVDLATTVKKDTLKTSEQKDVAVYRFQYTPEQRGDYAFVIKTAPLWMEEEQLFLKDTVRVTLHVLTQKGWDNRLDKGFEMGSHDPSLRPGAQNGLSGSSIGRRQTTFPSARGNRTNESGPPKASD